MRVYQLIRVSGGRPTATSGHRTARRKRFDDLERIIRMVSSAIPIITFRYYPYKKKKLTFWVSPILCFGSQETAMLCNQLFLGSLSSFSLFVPYVCIIHNRSTDEDGSVSTEADTEYQGYGKTTDRLAAEDCDSKHCHESRY